MKLQAAFSGFCVQSNGIKFPWPITVSGESITAATPADQWDAMPLNGKLQIIGFVGFLEFYSELVGKRVKRSAKRKLKP